MYIKGQKKSGFTLIEVMVASSLGVVVMTVVGMLSWYSSRSFAATANYVSLDQNAQFALDKMSREIRQARSLTSFSPTSLTLLDVDNQPLQFAYNPDTRVLMRISGEQTNILLTGCDTVQFAKFQRTSISNTFDAYEPAFVTNTKLIQITWSCSRSILGAKVNSESLQSSKITLRNHN